MVPHGTTLQEDWCWEISLTGDAVRFDRRARRSSPASEMIALLRNDLRTRPVRLGFEEPKP